MNSHSNAHRNRDRELRWFYEMAAASYAEKEYAAWRDSEKPVLSSSQEMQCQRVWARLQKELCTLRRQKYRETAGKAGARLFRIFAAVLLGLGLLFGTAFLTVDAFRVRVMNFILEQERTHTRVTVEGASPTTFVRFEPSYLPEGYVLTENDDDPEATVRVYENTQGQNIVYTQMSSNTGMNIDTEGAWTETIQFQGQEAFYIENADNYSLVWYTPDYLFTLDTSEGREVLLRIAESIQKAE